MAVTSSKLPRPELPAAEVTEVQGFCCYGVRPTAPATCGSGNSVQVRAMLQMSNQNSKKVSRIEEFNLSRITVGQNFQFAAMKSDHMYGMFCSRDDSVALVMQC